MFFRKLVLTLYILQTLVSSLPRPCYGMEYNNSLEEKEPSGTVRLYGSADFSVDSSDDLNTWDTIAQPINLNDLIDDLNLCIEAEQQSLFPDFYEKHRGQFEVKNSLNHYVKEEEIYNEEEHSKLVFTQLEQANTLLTYRGKNEEIIVNRKKAREQLIESLTSLNKILEKHEANDYDKEKLRIKLIDQKLLPDGLIPWTNSKRTWGQCLRSIPEDMGLLEPMELRWKILRGIGIFTLGGILLYGYGCSSWGIDPTRLYFMGSAFPFLPLQGSLSIGLSFGMSIYHMFPYLMEGANKVAALYKFLFINWGVPDTHGFRTKENEIYKVGRDLYLGLTEEDKENRHYNEILIAQSQKIRTFESDLAVEKGLLERNIAQKKQSLQKARKEEGILSQNKEATEEFETVRQQKLEQLNAKMYMLMNEISKKEEELENLEKNSPNNLKEIINSHQQARKKLFNMEGTPLQEKVHAISQKAIQFTFEKEEKLVQAKDKTPHINDIEGEYELAGKTCRYGIIGLIAIMHGLLYALTFLTGEIYNFQSTYGYGFVGAVFLFIFGTEGDRLNKQYTHWRHETINKQDAEVDGLKTALIQTLDKTEEMIINSDEYTNLLCKVDHLPEVSKLSSLFMNFKALGILGDSDTVRNETIAATKPHHSSFRDFAEFIAKLSVGAWVIAEFLIFSSITEENITLWASVPVGILVATSTIIKDWKEQPKVYAKVLEGLSWRRPAFLLNWLFFTTSLASAVWSVAFHAGILSALLGNDRPLVKYPIYGLCLSKVPDFLEWERERWSDLIRLAFTNRITTHFFKTTAQAKLHLIGTVIPQAKEAIHEWDRETTIDFANRVLGIKSIVRKQEGEI